MRNFSKTLISMAAVMAVGSAMAAGAMAAVDFSNSIEYAGDTVTFSGVTEGKSQYTLLVVAKDENGEFVATEGTIKQIDQNDNGSAFSSAVVGTLEKGDYKILVGNNDGTVDSGIFTVGGVEYVDIVVGDVNFTDNKANGLDALLILKKDAGMDEEGEDCGFVGETRTLKDGGTIVVGDVNFTDNKANGLDALLILKKDAGMDEEGEDCGFVGEPRKVEKK